jgi:hypothetical protein
MSKPLEKINNFSFKLLFPMIEVNMITKKIFFIDFPDELELFIGEKQFFTKKKIRHSVTRVLIPGNN